MILTKLFFLTSSHLFFLRMAIGRRLQPLVIIPSKSHHDNTSCTMNHHHKRKSRPRFQHPEKRKMIFIPPYSFSLPSSSTLSLRGGSIERSETASQSDNNTSSHDNEIENTKLEERIDQTIYTNETSVMSSDTSADGYRYEEEDDGDDDDEDGEEEGDVDEIFIGQVTAAEEEEEDDEEEDDEEEEDEN